MTTPESPTPDLTARDEDVLALMRVLAPVVEVRRHYGLKIEDAEVYARAVLAAGFGPVRAVEAERDHLQDVVDRENARAIAAEVARDAALRDRDEARAALHVGAELDNHHNADACPYCTGGIKAARDAAVADAAGLRERLMHDTTRRLMAQEYLIDMSNYHGQDLTRHAQAMAAAVRAALATPVSGVDQNDNTASREVEEHLTNRHDESNLDTQRVEGDAGDHA